MNRIILTSYYNCYLNGVKDIAVHEISSEDTKISSKTQYNAKSRSYHGEWNRQPVLAHERTGISQTVHRCDGRREITDTTNRRTL